VPQALGAFGPMLDVRCPVAVMLGAGSITVRACLALGVNSVLSLQQSAGEDLCLNVKGVTLARGEIVIVDDSAALRVTEIVAPPPPKAVP
jgi:flagellar motor switch/type III secretory pathway protein FliN